MTLPVIDLDVPDMPPDVRCYLCVTRRAMHVWGMALDRDDHTCCVHWVLSGGDPSLDDPQHPECTVADDVILGRRPESDLYPLIGTPGGHDERSAQDGTRAQ